MGRWTLELRTGAGRRFADRYHDRILKTPREVRNALRYVLANGKKRAAVGREVRAPKAGVATA